MKQHAKLKMVSSISHS